MKKLFAILMMAITCLTLAACGETSSISPVEAPEGTVTAGCYAHSLNHDPTPVKGLDITVSIPGEEDIVYYATAQDGCMFRDAEGVYDTVEKQNGESCGWDIYNSYDLSDEDMMWDGELTGEVTYVDILIYQKEQLVGYAVIRIEWDGELYYVGDVVECVTFFGQKPSKDWVRDALAAAREK